MRNVKQTLFRTVLGAGLAAGALLTANPALADDDVAPTSTAPAGEEAIVRGIQAPRGMLAVRIGLGVGLDSGAAGEPIAIMPDVYYGVTDRLQLGLIHSGPMGMQTRPGPGLCLTGTDGGCPNVYDNIGFDAMYGLVFGDKLHASAHGSIYATSFDAGTAMLGLGVALKGHVSDRVAIAADPQLGIQLAKRDAVDDALFMPVELQYQVAAPTSAELLTGVSASLSEFGDTYRVPVGVGVVHNLTPMVDVGARFSFDNLLGAQPAGASRTDQRSAMGLVNLRL